MTESIVTSLCKFYFLPLSLCNKLLQFPFTDSWPANRTCFMRTKETSLSTTFLLLSDSHHHYQISIVSPTPPPTHYRLYIEPTSTPHLPIFTAQLHLSRVPNLEMALGANLGPCAKHPAYC